MPTCLPPHQPPPLLGDVGRIPLAEVDVEAAQHVRLGPALPPLPCNPLLPGRLQGVALAHLHMAQLHLTHVAHSAHMHKHSQCLATIVSVLQVHINYKHVWYTPPVFSLLVL